MIILFLVYYKIPRISPSYAEKHTVNDLTLSLLYKYPVAPYVCLISSQK